MQQIQHLSVHASQLLQDKSYWQRMFIIGKTV